MRITHILQVFYEKKSYLFLKFMEDPIGQRIMLIRKEYYSNQKAFADAVNLTQSAISRAEKDGSLSRELVLYMRNTHNININWLYTGEPPMQGTSNFPSEELVKRMDTLQIMVDELTKDITDLIKERAVLRNKLESYEKNKKAS